MKKQHLFVLAIVVFWVMLMFANTLSGILFGKNSNGQPIISTDSFAQEIDQVSFYADGDSSFVPPEPNGIDPGPDPPWPPDTTKQQ